jgi:hypothetical protein
MLKANNNILNTNKEEKIQACAMVSQLVKTLPPKSNYALTVKNNLAQKGIEVKLSTVYQVGCGKCYNDQVIEEIIYVVNAWTANQKKVNLMLQEALKQV